MLIKLELFVEKSRFSTADEGESRFVHNWLTLVIDQKGGIHIVRPSDADRKAIEKLTHSDQYELDKRFNALARRQAE